MNKCVKKILCSIAFCLTLSSCSVFQVFDIKYVPYCEGLSSYNHPTFYFDSESLNLRPGDKKKLKILYKTQYNEKIASEENELPFNVDSWESTDTKVATVSSKGEITDKGAGTTAITAIFDKVTLATCYVTVSDEKISLSELFTRYAALDSEDQFYKDWLCFKKTEKKDKKTYTYALRYKANETQPYFFNVQLEDNSKSLITYQGNVKFGESGFINGDFTGSVTSASEGIFSGFTFERSFINFNSKTQTIYMSKNDMPKQDDSNYAIFDGASGSTADQKYTAFTLIQNAVSFYNEIIKEHNAQEIKLI